MGDLNGLTGSRFGTCRGWRPGIMERYAVTTDKPSGIRNDPNDWAKEVEKRY